MMRQLLNLLWPPLACGLVCLVLCGCERAQPSNEENPVKKGVFDQKLLDPIVEQVGRYQIISAATKLPDGKSQQLILKIDSATGKTWKYQTAVVDTGLSDLKYLDADGWLEIPEDFSESVDKARNDAEKFKSGAYKLGK